MDPNDKLEEARRHLRMIDALNGRHAAQLGIMKSQGGATPLDRVRTRWKFHRADYQRMLADLLITGLFLAWVIL